MKSGPPRPGLLARVWKWIDQRTGVDGALRKSLDEPIPGGARFAYVFGSALLFLFISQIVTGVCLALYYVPAPTLAHTSVAYIVKDVAAGSFLRSLHSYGSSAMIVVLVLHFLQTLLYGSYKGKRQLLWISGCVLALFVLVMAFTGYLLSWQQSAYSAGAVGTDIAGQVPFIGESLRRLLRGGTAMGALTLSRFYVLHILLVPALILSFAAAHLVFFRKAGAAGPPVSASSPRLPTEPFYPKQVLIDMAFVLLVMGGLGMMAHFVPVALGLEADPTNTTYLPRPEWYFLPMFQWLKYWEGWRTVIGVFVIPVILLGLVFSLPFFDRGQERRPWRRPIPVGGVLIVLLGMLWLGLTSRLQDSRDPTIAAQLVAQRTAEDAFFHAPFRPYSASTSGAIASTSVASKASSSGNATASSSGNVTASSSGPAAGAEGKGIFEAQGCSGCHGASGGGAKGPALTHIVSKYPAARLTALLKAPTPPMKAGGMVPLTLDALKFKALVAYLGSLGGAATSAPSSTTAAGSAAAGSAPAQTGSQVAGTPGQSASGPGAVHQVSGHSPPTAGDPASGEQIYALHCAGCHGPTGEGDGNAGRALGFKPTNFTTTGSNDAGWLKTIHLGSEATGKSEGMKGFKGELTDEQTRDVLAYLKTFTPATSR